MKRLLWLGLTFLSVSWLFLIPIFTPTNYTFGIFFLTVGIILNIFSFWKNDFKKIDRKYFIILIPLVIFIYIFQFPYNLGPIILTIGVILYIFKMYIFKNKKVNWFLIGVWLSGIIISAQTFFLPLYSIFASHNHRVDVLSPVVSSIINLFGLKTSVNNGIVFVQTTLQTYPFTITWEKLGFFTWFNILIGVLVLFIFLPKIRKFGIYILGFFLYSFIYLILRYVFFIFIFTKTMNISIFWDPFIITLSFLPFALLIIIYTSFKDITLNLDSFNVFIFNKNRVLAMLMIFLFVFSIVGAFIFQDPGTEKQGRILIDEMHSDWEDSTRLLDKDWYGMLSTYNYYCWAEWLGKYYKVDRNINNSLNSGLLNNYDILILKCPTNSYSNNEVKAIVDFVDNGGGLYLIGDHTNVFGMNYYLNQISENFGITFNTDATYELDTGKLSVYKPDSMFSHPVVQNIEEFDFLTSCTLSAPLTSENVIVGYGLMSEPGTYSTENFFRESVKSPDMDFGLILQVAGLKYGKGRILAFTDSTCLSNFCVFMDGYQSFNLGTIEYLNRINAYSYLNMVFGGISITSLVLFVYLLRKENKTILIFLFLLVGLLTFSVAGPAFSNFNKVNYPLPNAHSDYTKICFDQEHSDFIISPSSSTYSMYSSNYFFNTFFVWTQRVGGFPSLEKTFNDAIDKGNVVVIINPIKSFEDKEVDVLKEYINDGGNVLLMDSIFNKDSTANELLQNFGLFLNVESSDYSLYESLNDSLSNLTIGGTTKPYLSIYGGDNVFIDGNNDTSVAVVELGEGKIVVVVDSYSFSDSVMGGTFTEPGESLRKIYDTEFYIFEELFNKK